MTHEELIEVLEHTAQDGMADEPVLKALRAVVKLHKPDVQGKCDICTWITNGGGVMYFACPTIQAIEKELQYD